MRREKMVYYKPVMIGTYQMTDEEQLAFEKHCKSSINSKEECYACATQRYRCDEHTDWAEYHSVEGISWEDL